MIVRPATAADVSAILVLEHESPQAAHWSRAEYEHIFTPGHTARVALVVEQEGKLLGFLIGRALGPDWELENVAVTAHARRSGVATQLANEFLKLARARGASSVFLEVRKSNSAARALYEKLSFREAGRRNSYYNNPVEDALVYRLAFPESR